MTGTDDAGSRRRGPDVPAAISGATAQRDGGNYWQTHSLRRPTDHIQPAA